MEKNVAKANEFDYRQVDALSLFEGTHPAVMKDRIEKKNWKFDFDISKSTFSRKERLKRYLEKLTGRRVMEYKNYRIVV